MEIICTYAARARKRERERENIEKVKWHEGKVTYSESVCVNVLPVHLYIELLGFIKIIIIGSQLSSYYILWLKRDRERERDRDRERGDNDKYIIKRRETVCMHHHSHLTQYHHTYLTTIQVYIHIQYTLYTTPFIISMSTFIE